MAMTPPEMPEITDEQKLATAINMSENVMLIINQLRHEGHSDQYCSYLNDAITRSADVVVNLRCMRQVLFEEQRQQQARREQNNPLQ